MNKTSNRLATGIKANKLIAASVVIGVVSLFGIVGMLAGSESTTSVKASQLGKHSSPAVPVTNIPPIQFSESASSTVPVEPITLTAPTSTAAPTDADLIAADYGPVDVPVGGAVNLSVTPTITSDATSFNRALVSLTFDDGWKSIHSNGLPALQKHGFVSTQYINSDPILGGFDGYMSYEDIQAFAADGHEIGWHTRSHTDLVAADDSLRRTELTPQTDFVQQLMSLNVATSRSFASPFGSYDNGVIAAIRANSFTSHRSTDAGYNSKTDLDTDHAKLDAYNIKVQNVLNTTTTAEVQAWVADAIATKSWLVIVYHEVSNAPVDPDPTYSVTTAGFDQQLQAIQASGSTVLTVQTALAELQSQL